LVPIFPPTWQELTETPIIISRAKITEYFFMLFMFYNVVTKNHAIVAFPNLLVKNFNRGGKNENHFYTTVDKMNNITKKTSRNKVFCSRVAGPTNIN
jgi:hypothetical protein